MTTKHVAWVGTSLADIQALPGEVRRQLGRALYAVQCGGMPPSWRPMPSIGAGVIEVRVQAGGAFRLMYVAKFAEAIYVLHVFQKKSRQTSPLDIAVTRVRYGVALRSHREFR